MYLGVDTGGTFTDFVLIDSDNRAAPVRTHKILSTPAAPEKAILQGLREMGLAAALRSGSLRIVHGSTVATNAALEGKGVRCAVITSSGFRDMLTIGRQARPALFDLEPLAPAAPVAPELCLECGSRITADGSVESSPADAELAALTETLGRLKPEAIAINLLFSFLAPEQEERIAERLRLALPGTFISRSSVVLPEYREYERGIATWLNAGLGPLMARYLTRLSEATAPSPLSIMQSNGGTIDAAQAAGRAVNLLLSGPAGGLAAARALGRAMGETRLMTFDMGGTSTDVALMEGDFRLTSEGRIGPWPVAVPMVDMHTIGAGGGSLAHIDTGGALQVGPRSAGAEPGPACYGRGGEGATVTDANLVLGRLPTDLRLAGSVSADREAAEKAVAALAGPLGLSLEAAAEGIIRVANEHMARALRVISVGRGHDPAGFRLCCFGGAGGLHLCRLAEALGMHSAMIPANGGVLSAMGMLLAAPERHLSRTFNGLLDELEPAVPDAIAATLIQQGRSALLDEQHPETDITAQTSVDLRYRGQSAWLNIPWETPQQAREDFHSVHARRFGHALDSPVEMVNVRVIVAARPALDRIPRVAPGSSPATPCGHQAVYGCSAPVPILKRNQLVPGQQVTGPALVTETTATAFVDPGWRLTVDDFGSLLLDREISGPRRGPTL